MHGTLNPYSKIRIKKTPLTSSIYNHLVRLCTYHTNDRFTGMNFFSTLAQFESMILPGTFWPINIEKKLKHD